MDEDRMQTVSIRVPEETYERLKRYAEDHGESVSDVLRRLIDGVLAGGEQPEPAPGPGPAPQPGPAIPAELLELPGKVQAILAYEVQMQQYVGALAGRVGELQRAVLGILAVMFPGAPVPPWGVLSAVEQVRGLAELAQVGESAGQAPGTE